MRARVVAVKCDCTFKPRRRFSAAQVGPLGSKRKAQAEIGIVTTEKLLAQDEV
jgi:hypothetical protein